MKESLWGDLPAPEDVTPPSQILEVQARVLEQATRSVLRGDVGRRMSVDGRSMELTFYVVAPLLQDYRYALCRATYNPAALYPVELHAVVYTAPAKTCANEEAFKTALGEILQSEATKKAVAALLRESTHRDGGQA